MRLLRPCLFAGLLALMTSCQCSTGFTLRVHVVGQGQVVAGSASCDSDCELRVSAETAVEARPADGWRFVGWGGVCAGNGACVLASAGELTATFAEASALVVTVSGPGSVLASDGRRCTSGECRWATSGPIGLTALPATGAEFVGFTGACTGTGRCTLSEGAVTATFQLAGEVLQLDFAGNGSGVVRDLTGDYSCNQSCSVRLPRGVEFEFHGEPAAGSVFKGFSGACSGERCQVTAPGSVTARFEIGRRVIVTTQGNGGGAIAVNGAACAPPCDVIVPTDVPVNVSAVPDDTSRFLGFSGDCAGSMCSVPAGTGDLSVTVDLESVLQWVRSFPIPSAEGHSVALYADDAGILAVASVRHSMEIDGVLFTEPFSYRNGSPYFIELGWDAGVQSAFPLYDYTADAGYTRVDVASVTRGPTGSYFAFGMCQQGRLLGQSCGDLNMPQVESTPFVLEFLDGGVLGAELRSEMQDSNDVGFLDSHLVGDAVVARVYQHDQQPNGRAGFYVRPNGADAGSIVLASDMLSSGSFFTRVNHRECLVEGESLVCVSPVSGGFTGLGCPSSAPGGPLAAYRYTPSTGACQLEWRMPAAIAPVSAGLNDVVLSRSGRLLALGGTFASSGMVDFGSGFTLTALNEWVAAFSSGIPVSLWPTDASAGQLARPVAMVASEQAEVLVLTKNGPAQPGPVLPIFGVPLTAEDSAYVLTFDSAGQVSRKWPLIGAASNPEEILNGSMTRVGDDIVVAVMGSGFSFRGEPLAPDLQMRLFVMVFRE